MKLPLIVLLSTLYAPILSHAAEMPPWIVHDDQGVEKIFYHVWGVDANRDPGIMIFFEYGGFPRKVFAAQSQLANVLAPSARFVCQAKLPEDLFTFVFDAPTGPVAVLWSPGGERHGVRSLLRREADWMVEDMVGNPVSDEVIPYTPSPVYVRWPGGKAEALAERIAALTARK